MNQHEMRRIALQALYLANQEPELTYNEIVGRTTKALDLKAFPELSGNLLKGILEQKPELDEEISKYLKSGWRIERLAQIDRAILELGLYEIKNSDQIDPVAALDEALNLGEEFSSEKSKAFINGVLGNFIEEK